MHSPLRAAIYARRTSQTEAQLSAAGEHQITGDSSSSGSSGGGGSGGGGGGGGGSSGASHRNMMGPRQTPSRPMLPCSTSCASVNGNYSLLPAVANKHQGEAVVPACSRRPSTKLRFPSTVCVDLRVADARFLPQGIQFPVLPRLARSLGLGTADLGLVTACTSCARLQPMSPRRGWQKVGRRPMLMSGPSMAAVGMLGLANASSFEHLVVSNICVGTGLATTMAGASLYLSDVSTPRNRAQSTAPLLQSALLGFAIGPAIGGGLAQYMGLHLPFVACAGGLFASSIASAALLPETREEVRTRRNRQRELLRSARQAAEDGDDAGREGWSEAAAARGAVEKDGGGTGQRRQRGGGMAAWLLDWTMNHSVC